MFCFVNVAQLVCCLIISLLKTRLVPFIKDLSFRIPNLVNSDFVHFWMDIRPKQKKHSEMQPNFIKGHIKVVKFLADLEIISIDLRTKKGETACDIAKRNGHQNVVDFLNSWRISPNRLPHETRHSIYIRTVSSQYLLSNLLNCTLQQFGYLHFTRYQAL